MIFREKEIAKEKFCTTKKPIKIWDVNVDNIVVTKSVETKTISKIGTKFDKVIRPLVLIMPKMGRHLKLKIKSINNAFLYR